MYEQANIGPIRPPSEAHSLLIRVTMNCPWNKCEFCSAFKGLKFHLRPLPDIEADIAAAMAAVDAVLAAAKERGQTPANIARYRGMPWVTDEGVKNVFLQDSDSLAIKTEPMLAVLAALRRAFPGIERVCTYARGHTIYRKTATDLQRLREAGLSRVHIGLETGDDELLAYVNKGATAAQMIEAGRRAVAAGMEVSEYIMPGLGGRERWEQHAVNSAKVLNKVNPRFIRLRTFHPRPGTPIFDRGKAGEYHLQTIEGVLLEVRRFIEELDVSSELVSSDFASNYIYGPGFDGVLPGAKPELLAALDRALAYWRANGEPARHPFSPSIFQAG